MKNIDQKNVLLFTVVLFFCLFFMECFLRIVSPPIHMAAGWVQAPKARFYGWAYFPNNVIINHDPDTGKPYFCETNSQGWRDTEHVFKKPTGTIRILFLGDSVTTGRVPLGNLYTRQTEYLLKKKGFFNIEVIGISEGGWGTDQELEALQREGILYSPDFIIYQFSANDVFDNILPLEGLPRNEHQWGKVFKYKIENGNLRKIRLNPPKRLSPSQNRIKNFLLKSAIVYNLNKAKNIVRNYYFQEPPSLKTWWFKHPVEPLFALYIHAPGHENEIVKEGWELLEKLIVRMKEVSEKNGAQFLLFSEDEENGKRKFEMKWNRIRTDGSIYFAIIDNRKYTIDFKDSLKKLTKICGKNNIPLIETKREYERYTYDPHPNRIGNMRMAEDIVDFLTRWEPFLNKFKNR